MNIFSEKVTCDVCGGPGVAMPGTAARGWFKGTSIRHSDPRVCADYLDSSFRDCVGFVIDQKKVILTLEDDQRDGMATILMLQTLEQHKYNPVLRVALDELGLLDGIPTYGTYRSRPGWYECWLSAYQLSGPLEEEQLHNRKTELRQEYFGPTRSWAVGGAFANALTP